MMNTLHRALLAVAFTGTLPLVALACGGSKDSNQAQQPGPGGSYGYYGATPGQPGQPGYGQQPPPGYPQQQQPGGYPAQGQPQPAPTMGQPQPTATQPAPGQTAAPAPAANAQVVGALMAPIAATQAPGMQPEGEPFTGNLTEGQHASITVNMTAGKCYTVIGISPPGVGVSNLNLNLLTPPLYTLSAGQDNTTSNQAVIGGGKNPTCPMVPFPVPYKLDISAAKGAGFVAVQVYSKTK